ncbi:hypothetical protein GJ688_14985 [Heliobacillus mobilis]|uniref:DNA ligase (ATP) n=1 Tax=Heliobacterium mobile TaxID=28064 RepID=A0A6I3SMQ2_HELMO|nr:hypothetical protein [Heliobacterium mobile]MTV50278.1 hypothetical protein [Heliobacterium mobile]
MKPIQPMEPVIAPEPFDDPDYLFQIKWDGIRALAYVQEKGIRLFNRKGREITKQYPEITGADILLPGEKGIVDGELIVLDETGKPSFPLVLRRDRMQTAGSILRGVQQYPVQFMVFDLLDLNDESLLEKPLDDRLDMLSTHLVTGQKISLTESYQEEGNIFFQGIQDLGLEGMVAKEKQSSYISGKKHSAWKKIKNFRTITCWVIGYTQSLADRIASLALGAENSENSPYLGRVSSGITDKEAVLWYQRLYPDRRNLSTKVDYQPVTPRYRVKVRFLEWTPDLRLRHPSYLGEETGLT